MRFLSVASGIEAASVAWSVFGWKAWAVAEIDAFPATVLHHHYGTGRPHHMPSPDADDLTQDQRDERALAITRVAGLPLRTLADGPVNLGDMNAYKEWPDASLDLLCGGTPCQSFSNAGLRAGLDDPRGQLMLTFGAIAARYRPQWLVWENVPGVLSSNGGRDFGAFLGLLGFLGYGFAYRVLDAQFVRVDGHGRAVPQRRNRVFVVGCLGDWRSAGAVLLERESLRGDPAPRREAGARIAATLTRGADGSGGSGYAGRRQEDDVNVIAGAITAGMGRRSAEDPERDLLVAGALTGGSDGAGWRIGPDEAAGHQLVAATITAQFGEQTGQDAKNGNLVLAFGGNNTAGAIDVATACRAHGGSGHIDFESETFIAHTLRGEGFDASDDGTGQGTPLVPICFDPTQITSGENRSNPQPGDPCHTLAKGAHAPAIAFPARMSGTQYAGAVDLSPLLGAENPTAIAFNARQDPINGPINGPIDTDGSTNGVMVPVGDEDADAAQAGPLEALRTLRDSDDPQAFSEWCLGVVAQFWPTEVLRSEVHGRRFRRSAQPERGLVNVSLSRSEVGATWSVQDLWEAGCEGRAPQGWRSHEQRAGELGAYLSLLPHSPSPAERFVRCLRRSDEGSGVLRQALSALQDARRSIIGEGQSAPSGIQVRRLMVDECEALQGFARGYTNVPWRGKPAADGPRYKALGNSWAINCARWVGRRIALVDSIRKAAP